MTTPGHGLPAWVQQSIVDARSVRKLHGVMKRPNPALGRLAEAVIYFSDLVAACPPQEPDVKDALLEICRRIEAWPSDCVETHRERAAYSGNLIRAVYAIAEQALAALPGAVPARKGEK